MHFLDDPTHFEITVRVTSMDTARAVAALLIRSELYDRVDDLCIATDLDSGALEGPFGSPSGDGPQAPSAWGDEPRRTGT